MMDTASLHMPSGVPDSVQVLRYDLPLAQAGAAAGASSSSLLGALGGADANFEPGSLRVRVLEAEGLAPRSDGSACKPYVTVAVAELTRRRTRRTDSKPSSGGSVSFSQAFDFEDTQACAQVVVDVWDRPLPGSPPDLLGKAVLNLSECRPGVPHTYFKHLLEGKLVRAALPPPPTCAMWRRRLMCCLCATLLRSCGYFSTLHLFPQRPTSSRNTRPSTPLRWREGDDEPGRGDEPEEAASPTWYVPPLPWHTAQMACATRCLLLLLCQ